MAAATLLAALALPAAAPAAGQPSQTYIDQAASFRITIPKTWKMVPRSLAAVKAEITKLKASKQTKLASVFEGLIATSTGRDELKNFVFQAFLYPPISPIPTEVSLAIVATPKAYTRAELPSIGAAFEQEFAASKGAQIDKPQLVTLPCGASELIEGSEPVANGVRTGIELYVIPHGKRLFELAFQIDARYLAKATILSAIAHAFGFI